MSKIEPKPGDLYKHIFGGVGMITDKGDFFYLTSATEVVIVNRGKDLHRLLDTEAFEYLGNLIDVGRVENE